METHQTTHPTIRQSFFRTLAICLLTTTILLAFSGCQEPPVDITVALKDVITTSQLQTTEYTYNAIATVKDGETIKYYVSYNGTVIMGINFADIDIQRDNTVIRIILPDVTITDVTVGENLDFLFTKEKYNKEGVLVEARKACEEDLLTKASTNENLMISAQEYTKDTIVALTKPFESRLEEGETIEIVFSSQVEVVEQ